jgi:hypothetical protein
MEINRLTITTEIRILGDEYVRFGGEYIETCFHKGKQGALCLAIELKQSNMARDAYDCMIDLAEKTYNIPVRKNSGAK